MITILFLLSYLKYNILQDMSTSKNKKGVFFMCNKEIRDYARINNVKLWQIADKLNLYDSNFSRLLRHELSEEKKQQIYNIIDELASK